MDNVTTVTQTLPETPSQIEKLKLVKSHISYKLIVNTNLESKIRFLCQKSPDKEWSGALFYTVEGSFEDNNLVVIAQDLFLMDIGSSVYTEFDMSPEVVNYMINNDLLDLQVGLIH